MRSTLKTTVLVLISFVLINMSSVALAWSVGDRVHVVFGSGSSAEVESGYIVAVGSSNSKVEWDYCSNCSRWVSNSAFYRSFSSAADARDEMDASHVSIGEAAGAAAVVGLLYLFMNAN